MDKMKNFLFFIFMFFGSLFFNECQVWAYEVPQNVSSRCKGEICFPEVVFVEGQELSLKGIATFKYLFFTLYTGAFYAPQEVHTSHQVLDDHSKVLILQYHRSIRQEDFIQGSEKALKKNPAFDRQRVQSELEKIYRAYQDVNEGDQYALEYNSGGETKLFLNKKLVETFSGKLFMSYYFGIWLSPWSLSDETREALLGNGS
jgi:hypothetical protein